MFTGLIETLGQIVGHSPDHSELRIRVPNPTHNEGQEVKAEDDGRSVEKPKWFLDGVKTGDSIAINGACLTVINDDFSSNEFSVNLAPETLSRTNLSELKLNDYVNLEKSLNFENNRIGGHFVQGHVDTTATIKSMTPDSDSLRVTFSLPVPSSEDSSSPSSPDGFAYLIPKGYVSIDGVSLTLTHADRSKREFSIMLVPHTIKHINLPSKKVSDKVNVEFDMLVKTIANVLENSLEQKIQDGVRKVLKEMKL